MDRQSAKLASTNEPLCGLLEKKKRRKQTNKKETVIQHNEFKLNININQLTHAKNTENKKVSECARHGT